MFLLRRENIVMIFLGGGEQGEGSMFSLLIASGVRNVICWKGGGPHLFSVSIKG